MELKANAANILMSDVLRGNVPELENEQGQDVFAGKHVLVVAEKVTGNSKIEGLVGILRGVLFDIENEIEFRIDLTEALNLVSAQNLFFTKFELHHDERIVSMPGPFIIKACRIDDISVQDQLCTISLHLKKQSR